MDTEKKYLLHLLRGLSFGDINCIGTSEQIYDTANNGKRIQGMATIVGRKCDRGNIKYLVVYDKPVDEEQNFFTGNELGSLRSLQLKPETDDYDRIIYNLPKERPLRMDLITSSRSEYIPTVPVSVEPTRQQPKRKEPEPQPKRKELELEPQPQREISLDGEIVLMDDPVSGLRLFGTVQTIGVKRGKGTTYKIAWFMNRFQPMETSNTVSINRGIKRYNEYLEYFETCENDKPNGYPPLNKSNSERIFKIDLYKILGKNLHTDLSQFNLLEQITLFITFKMGKIFDSIHDIVDQGRAKKPEERISKEQQKNFMIQLANLYHEDTIDMLNTLGVFGPNIISFDSNYKSDDMIRYKNWVLTNIYPNWAKQIQVGVPDYNEPDACLDVLFSFIGKLKNDSIDFTDLFDISLKPSDESTGNNASGRYLSALLRKSGIEPTALSWLYEDLNMYGALNINTFGKPFPAATGLAVTIDTPGQFALLTNTVSLLLNNTNCKQIFSKATAYDASGKESVILNEAIKDQFFNDYCKLENHTFDLFFTFHLDDGTELKWSYLNFTYNMNSGLQNNTVQMIVNSLGKVPNTGNLTSAHIGNTRNQIVTYLNENNYLDKPEEYVLPNIVSLYKFCGDFGQAMYAYLETLYFKTVSVVIASDGLSSGISAIFNRATVTTNLRFGNFENYNNPNDFIQPATEFFFRRRNIQLLRLKDPQRHKLLLQSMDFEESKNPFIKHRGEAEALLNEYCNKQNSGIQCDPQELEYFINKWILCAINYIVLASAYKKTISIVGFETYISRKPCYPIGTILEETPYELQFGKRYLRSLRK